MAWEHPGRHLLPILAGVSALAVDQVHRYSVAQYERLVELGAFAGVRVELLDGLVLDMSPKTPAHENVLEWLREWLDARLDRSRLRLRVCAPLRLPDGEPEPDLAVCDRGQPRDRHPSSALLVIEVALSSVDRDLTIKPDRYAAAAAEYWVVNLAERHVVIHRAPAAGRYRSLTVLHPGDEVCAAQVGVHEPVSVADLLAAA